MQSNCGIQSNPLQQDSFIWWGVNADRLVPSLLLLVDARAVRNFRILRRYLSLLFSSQGAHLTDAHLADSYVSGLYNMCTELVLAPLVHLFPSDYL
jgi:hypothetical protein